MAAFRLTNTAPPVWAGGPPAVCAACQFRNEQYEWFVVMDNVYAELSYDVSGGKVDASHPIILCPNHCAELKAVLDEVMPDAELQNTKAKLFRAEAARAVAEKRATAAEKALHAMQDWISEVPEGTIVPGKPVTPPTPVSPGTLATPTPRS